VLTGNASQTLLEYTRNAKYHIENASQIHWQNLACICFDVKERNSLAILSQEIQLQIPMLVVGNALCDELFITDYLLIETHNYLLLMFL
jgi:hypothetical protein